MIEKIICNNCNKEFKTQTGLSEHITKKHSGKVYSLSNHKFDCTCSCCKAKRGELSGADSLSFGKKHSEESKQKMSIAKKGKTYEEIYGIEEAKVMRQCRSKESTGRIQTPEKSRKISEKLAGKPKSLTHKQKLSEVWDIGHTAEVINRMAVNSRSQYKTGYFYSHKNCCDIFFASSYELYSFIGLEHDNNVKKYGRCTFSIPYIINGEMHRYVPDIGAQYIDNSFIIIEIKPNNLVENEDVVLKKLAAQKYCRENCMSYEMWTEKEIEQKLRA